MRVPRIRLRPRDLAITLGVLGSALLLGLAGQWLGPSSVSVPDEAPGLAVSALSSLFRMALAFALALAFAIPYGLLAATQPATRRYLLPLLDVAQSVPIPALFPVVVVVFIQTSGALFGQERFGVEAACVFLIFSVQVWNLAFGVYEAVTQIPGDLRRAADSFGLGATDRFLRLYLPASIPKLVYNSIASWANGWYFLTLCEIVDSTHRVRGIGSYLSDAVYPVFQPIRFATGLCVVLVVVVVLEFLLWRPLTAWSAKYRYDAIREGEEQTSVVLDWWRRSDVSLRARSAVSRLGRALGVVGSRIAAVVPTPQPRTAGRLVRALATSSYYGFFGGLVALGLAALLALGFTLAKPWPEDAATVPIALVKSGSRIFLAYVLTLAWTIPVALWVGRSPRRDRWVTPGAEMLAAVPAVAVWPILGKLFQPVFGTNATAVVMLMTGMQWYVLFNLIEGVKRLPADLDEAAQSLGLRGLAKVRRIFIPVMTPALVTGSVTAWGGGWNALNVAERFHVGDQVFECDGIGSRLVQATVVQYDPASLALNMLAMLVAVAVINRLVWHRLYDAAESRYSLDA